VLFALSERSEAEFEGRETENRKRGRKRESERKLA
jgi:hypothetical protein